MASIGDLVFSVMADTSKLYTGLEKDAAKAGDKAGGSFGKSFGNVVKLGLAGAGAAAFGLASKQMVELSSATSKLRAETGMTAAEAERAGAAINRMAGSNLQSVEQIGDTMSAVITNLGLTGEAADAATEQFLRFATATGQDAAGAVVAFDDILDAWGLEATDAAGIMDKLVFSSQEYGGSVEANQAALAGLAPALKAMNMGLDDGIEFLNLAAASGIDAASATAGLNKAIKELKPGENLDDLVAQLGAIEDPTLRAQRGIELFGKSGAKLANAIKPGTKSLDDYGVSADEAAGSSEEAADAIESSFGNRLKLALKGFASTVTEVLGPAGPVLTSFASLASLGTTLVPGFAGSIKGIATNPKVLEAAKAAGTAIGSAMGLAIIAGLLIAAPILINELRARTDEEQDAILERVEAGEGNLYDARAAAYIRRKRQQEAAQREVTADYQQMLDGMVTQTDEGGRAIGGSWTQGFATNEGIFVHEGAQAKLRAEGIIEQFGAGFAGLPDKVKPPAEEAGKAVGPAFARGINNTTSRSDVEAAWDALVDAFKNRQTATEEAAGLIGSLTGKKLAARLHDADPAVREAARNYRDTVIERLENMNVRAGIVTKEAAAAIETGLKSKDKEIAKWSVNAWRVVHNAFPTPEQTAGWGAAAMQAYGSALENQKDALATSAAKALQGVKAVMIALSPPGPKSPLHEIDKWGARTGLAWVDSFIEALGSAEELTKLKLAGVQKAFDKFLKNYGGISGMLPSAGPEMSRERLEGYIKTLNVTLAKTSDPAERLRILQQIAEYTDRLNQLQGKVSTEDERDAATLMGYLDKIDKALLTEKDPKKRAELIAKWVRYYNRLQALQAPDEPPDTVDPNAETPEEKRAEDARQLREVELDLRRLDLEKERAALALTPALEDQNRERIAAIDAELDLIRDQQTAIDNEREMVALLKEQARLRGLMAGGGGGAAAGGGAGGDGGGAAPGATPPGQVNTATPGNGQYVQTSPGVWQWVPTGAPVPGLTPPGPPMQNVGDLVSGPGGMMGTGNAVNQNVSLTVNNPAPEPAGVSVRTRLGWVASGLAGTG